MCFWSASDVDDWLRKRRPKLALKYSLFFLKHGISGESQRHFLYLSCLFYSLRSRHELMQITLSLSLRIIDSFFEINCAQFIFRRFLTKPFSSSFETFWVQIWANFVLFSGRVLMEMTDADLVEIGVTSHEERWVEVEIRVTICLWPVR